MGRDLTDNEQAVYAAVQEATARPHTFGTLADTLGLGKSSVHLACTHLVDVGLLEMSEDQHPVMPVLSKQIVIVRTNGLLENGGPLSHALDNR